MRFGIDPLDAYAFNECTGEMQPCNTLPQDIRVCCGSLK